MVTSVAWCTDLFMARGLYWRPSIPFCHRRYAKDEQRILGISSSEQKLQRENKTILCRDGRSKSSSCQQTVPTRQISNRSTSSCHAVSPRSRPNCRHVISYEQSIEKFKFLQLIGPLPFLGSDSVFLRSCLCLSRQRKRGHSPVRP